MAEQGHGRSFIDKAVTDHKASWLDPNCSVKTLFRHRITFSDWKLTDSWITYRGKEEFQ